MTTLYPVAEIREAEQTVLMHLAPGTLMQRAGQAAAAMALKLVGPARGAANILILAGPGNNGGDAFEAASLLVQAGSQVSIISFADPKKLSSDAQQALLRAKSGSAQFADPASLPGLASSHWTLVIDGLFGIGLIRPITGTFRSAVEFINALSCPVLALDIPSGLNADTGNIVGPDGVAVRASHTITFIADKPGLHTCDGRDFSGEIHVATLDIAPHFLSTPRAHLNDIALFAGCLKQRPHNSHKGSYGDVAVIGGAHGMTGALILAARAAAKCGAGRVYAVALGEAPAYDSAQPEVMCRRADDFDFSSASVVAGPGLGTSDAAHDLLIKVLTAQTPLVLDADALNLIALKSGLQQKLAVRGYPVMMTPHPLEAARLLAVSSADIQADRVEAARELARRFRAVVILKGSGTVIARMDGTIAINPTGNAGLATAGSGDVLSGICGALLAQNWPLWEAALGAVWLHGTAADILVREGIGPVGLTASELIPAARASLNRLIYEHADRTSLYIPGSSV